IPSLDDCARFLGTTARDNAIGFAQDRDAREWTVGYYLNNAVARLGALTYIDGFRGAEMFSFFRDASKRLASCDTHAEMAKFCIQASERAFEMLERAVNPRES